MADVRVITINGGRSAHLLRLLEGLARGTQSAECIVVEMATAPPRPAPPQPGVHRIHLNRGGLPLAAARNAGRRAAQADILIFLDVDCIPSADLIAVLTDHARARDALICCEVTYLPAGAVRDGWTEAGLRRTGRCHPARVFPMAGLAEAPQPGLFWSLAFGVRAATFDRIGGFDEAFSGYGAEDTDFAFRAAALHIPVLFSAEGHAFHQRHAAHDPPLQHFADIMENARRFHARHGCWPMRGWIDDFVTLGLIETVGDDDYRILRDPTANEVLAASIPDDRPF
jgi:GT2 family glycosyltransferase